MGSATLFSTVRVIVLGGVLAAAAMLAVGACGKSPASPSSSGSSGNSFTPGPLAAVPIYVGQVALSDGVSGTLLLRSSSSFSALSSAGPKMLDVVIGLLEVPLNAQGSSASGQLILPTQVIDLTGTYSGSTFGVSGSGYSLTATVSGASVSGSGSGPQGATLTVSPQPPPIAAPAPPDASGVYRGTFSITAPTRARSTSMANGTIAEDCNYSTLVTGTLTLQLQSPVSGTYAALLLDDWREADGPPGSCSPRLPNTPDPYTEFRGGSITPAAPKSTQAAVSTTAIQFGWGESGPALGGTHTRSAVFSGAVSGGTVIARYSRTRSWSNPRGEFLLATGGYQGSIDVTLVKQ